MLICSVCRSQNMDSAKFCGNCGSPFSQPSSAAPSVSTYVSSPSGNAAPSSLINCPQGHIYSSVYQDCPYCPQYENGNASEYETRIEEGPIQLGALDKPQNDFSTRTGADTLFEPIDQNPQNSPSSQRSDTATEVMSAISLTDPNLEKASISSDLRRSKPDVGKTPLPATQPPPPEPPRPEPPVVDSSWSPSSRTETPGW